MGLIDAASAVSGEAYYEVTQGQMAELQIALENIREILDEADAVDREHIRKKVEVEMARKEMFERSRQQEARANEELARMYREEHGVPEKPLV